MGAVRSYGGFELHEKIGAGGMATVYRGIQKSLNRPVVLKILHPHLSEDESLIVRFEREAHAAANLRHENIVQVIDCGREDDTSFIAMEYVEGLDLKKLQEKCGTPPPDIALLLIRDVCRGLEHAHEKGVIHRDIKPANLMLMMDGTVKVMDFGLARLGADSVGMTATGAVMGTPAYMSPEQARGEHVDARTDIFSLGVVAYEMLSGSRPFPGDSYAAVIHEILTREPDRLDRVNPNVPPEAADLVASMLRKSPDERCPSIAHALETLETLVERRGLLRGKDLLRRYAASPRDGSVTATPPGGDPLATRAGFAEATVATGAPPAPEELKTRLEAASGVTGPKVSRTPATGTGPAASVSPRSTAPPPAVSKRKPPVMLLVAVGSVVVVAAVVAVLMSQLKPAKPPVLESKHEDSGPLFTGTSTPPGEKPGGAERTGGGDVERGDGSAVRTGDPGPGGGVNTGSSRNTGGSVSTGASRNTGGAVNTGSSRNTGGAANTGASRNTGGTANTENVTRKYQISTKPFGLVYLDGASTPLSREGKPVQKSLSAGRHTFHVVNEQLGIDITCTYGVESGDRNNKLIINLKTGQVEASNSPDLPF